MLRLCDTRSRSSRRRLILVGKTQCQHVRHDTRDFRLEIIQHLEDIIGRVASPLDIGSRLVTCALDDGADRGQDVGQLSNGIVGGLLGSSSVRDIRLRTAAGGSVFAQEAFEEAVDGAEGSEKTTSRREVISCYETLEIVGRSDELGWRSSKGQIVLSSYNVGWISSDQESIEVSRVVLSHWHGGDGRDTDGGGRENSWSEMHDAGW